MSKHTVDIRQLLGSLNNKDSNSCKCYFLTLFTFISFKMSIIKSIKRVIRFQKFMLVREISLKWQVSEIFCLNLTLIRCNWALRTILTRDWPNSKIRSIRTPKYSDPKYSVRPNYSRILRSHGLLID